MKKQKITLKAIISLAIIFVILVPIMSFAAEETQIVFYANANTNVYNLGENVNVTINWRTQKDGMNDYGDVQAVGFTLQYDKDKLEFVDATYAEVGENHTITDKTLEEDFYNSETPGTIVVAKMSLNELDMTNITLNFKTIAVGSSNVNLTEIDCVANGNLAIPDIIDFTTNGTTTIETVAFGDANLDGIVNVKDLIRLRQYLEGEDVEIDSKNSDVNLDGTVDNIDINLIQEYLASNIKLPIRYGDVTLDGGVYMNDTARLYSYLMKRNRAKWASISKCRCKFRWYSK